MSPVIYDVLFALLIGGIIAWMATIKDPRVKSFVYILPFPISFALLATGVHINGLNVIGLGLVIVFLWTVFILHDRFKLHIIVADIIGASIYVILGYIAAQLAPPPFWLATSVYAVGWALFVIFYSPSKTTKTNQKPETIKPIQKFAGVSVIAFVLLRFKSLLEGIVVTFPFSGVFAVIEARHNLETLASIATRNSISLIGMFMVIAYLPSSLPPLVLIAAGWIVVLIILKIIYRFKIGRA